MDLAFSRNGAKRFIPIAYRVIVAVHFAHGNLGLLDVADFSLEFLASFGECIFNVVSCAERAGRIDLSTLMTAYGFVPLNLDILRK